MKKKSITQGVIYIVEVLSVSLLIISIYSYIEKGSLVAWTNNFFTLNFLSDFGVVFVVYQVLVYAFFSLHDSAINDGNLMIKTLIKQALLCLENEKTLEIIQKRINSDLYEKPNYYMYSEKQVEMLKELNFFLKEYENKDMYLKELIFYLENSLIILEHNTELNNLLWQNSIILRILK